MKPDTESIQGQLAASLCAMGQGVGASTGLTGAQIIESMVYGLAMACAEMTGPENRAMCITEAAKLLSSYADPMTVNTPLQSLATH